MLEINIKILYSNNFHIEQKIGIRYVFVDNNNANMNKKYFIIQF